MVASAFVAAMFVSVSCGSDEGPDHIQLVSEKCKELAKKKLRDPDSARFGDTEYIVEQKLTSHDTSAPPSEKSYDLVGLINGRNGFGGMGEEQLYTCHVAFDANGKIIDDSRTTFGGFDDAKFLDNYIGYAQDSGTGAPVKRSVNPDGTSKK